VEKKNKRKKNIYRSIIIGIISFGVVKRVYVIRKVVVNSASFFY